MRSKQMSGMASSLYPSFRLYLSIILQGKLSAPLTIKIYPIITANEPLAWCYSAFMINAVGGRVDVEESGVKSRAGWVVIVLLIADLVFLTAESSCKCFNSSGISFHIQLIETILALRYTIVVIWILKQGYAVITPLSDRTSPFLVLACYALVLCLLGLIILRIVEIYQKAKDQKASPAEDQKASPAEDQRASPAEEQKASPVEDQKASPVEEQKATPAEHQKAKAFWLRIWLRLRGVLFGRRIFEPHYE